MPPRAYFKAWLTLVPPPAPPLEPLVGHRAGLLLDNLQQPASCLMKMRPDGQAFLSVPSRQRPPFACVTGATHGDRRRAGTSALKRVRRETAVQPSYADSRAKKF